MAQTAKKKNLVDRVQRLIRILGFMFLQLIWPILKNMEWKTIFVVHAGRRNDVLAYCPGWLEDWFKSNRPVSPGGWILSKQGLSLVVVCPLTNDEIKSSFAVCRQILVSLRKLKTKRFALSGVLPSAIYSHGLWNEADERFVRDQMGTVYMMTDNVNEIFNLHFFGKESSMTVAVIGVGHTGSKVANRLADEGYRVIAFDARPEAGRLLSSSVQFKGQQYSEVSKAGLVILLTSKGDDGVKAVEDFLVSGTIVLSDTHPKVSQRVWKALEKKGISHYESAAELPGTYFFPKLPRFRKDSLPGCVVHAFTEALGDKFVQTQDEFDSLAMEVGIHGRLD